MEEGLVEGGEAELGVGVGASGDIDVTRVDQNAELRSDAEELEVVGEHVRPEGVVLEVRTRGALDPGGGTGSNGGLHVRALQKGIRIKKKKKNKD